MSEVLKRLLEHLFAHEDEAQIPQIRFGWARHPTRTPSLLPGKEPRPTRCSHPCGRPHGLGSRTLARSLDVPGHPSMPTAAR